MFWWKIDSSSRMLMATFHTMLFATYDKEFVISIAIKDTKKCWKQMFLKHLVINSGFINFFDALLKRFQAEYQKQLNPNWRSSGLDNEMQHWGSLAIPTAFFTLRVTQVSSRYIKLPHSFTLLPTRSSLMLSIYFFSPALPSRTRLTPQHRWSSSSRRSKSLLQLLTNIKVIAMERLW